MPTPQQHKSKYIENKEILDNLLDINNRKHCNWIATICFYTSLHMIEEKLAKEKNLHSNNHQQREELMRNSGIFSRNVILKYKQMETNSKVARYSEKDIAPTIANQMQCYMADIERELTTN